MIVEGLPRRCAACCAPTGGRYRGRGADGVHAAKRM